MLSRKSPYRVRTLTLAALFVVSAFPFVSLAQDATANKENNGQHANHTQADSSLPEQLRALQTKVAALEAALKQSHQGAQDPSGMQIGSMGAGQMKMEKSMGMMSGMGRMSGQGMSGMSGMGMGNMPTMGGMSGQGMSGMVGMSGMADMGMMGGKGMSMMGQMQDMGQTQMPSALPGFAGASHIYHIGATSFFLDHPQHISLTQDQQFKLNQIKERALLGQATFDRWISQGEQELWVLTSSEAPNAVKIEAKIREIEKVRGDKRIAYIRAVGDAARILTDEQRQILIGTMLPNHSAMTTGDQN